MTVKTISWFMNFFSIAPIISFVLFLPTYSILGDWALSLSLTQFFWVANPGLSGPGGGGMGAFDRLVNYISTRAQGGKLCPSHYYSPPGFSNLPSALRNLFVSNGWFFATVQWLADSLKIATWQKKRHNLSKSKLVTGYSFWDRLRNFWRKFTWIVLSVHKLNKLGKFW